MSDFLPPLVGRLVGDISGFAAKMGEATAIAKAETGASAAAFNGLATIGKAAFLGLGVAAVVGGGAAVKMAGDFESATNRLVTSAGEARGNIELVRKGMLDMAGQVGYSAMDLSKAMYIVESAGQHGANGLTVLRAAAEGAKAENADLAKVADAVTSALQDYHLPATSAAQVTTTLVAAVSQGKTTFEELTGSLHSVLPVASAAHISLADISAATASMTVHGMSADQATQNLAHAIEHLQKTTVPQQKELALLGLNARQLSDDLGTKGLTGTLLEVSNAIQQHMGPDGHVVLQMQQALAGLPPSVQKLGASVVNGTTSLGDFTKAAKGLNVEQAGLAHQFATLMTSTHGIGSAQKSGAEIAQTYAQALAAATGDATTLQVALMLTGDNAAYTTSAVKAVSGATTEAGNHVAGWASIQGTFNQKVDRMREGLGAVAITVGTALIPYVERAMDATAGLAGWLAKNQQVSIPLAVAIGGVLLVAIAAYTVSMAMAAIATIAATWPLLLIIAAVALVAAGIALLVMHWSQITAFLGGAWKTASTAAGNAFSALGSAVHGFVNGVLSAVGGFFNWLGTTLSKAWAEFASKPMYWIGFIVAFIPVKLFELEGMFVAWVASMIIAALKWANDMVNKAEDGAVRFVIAIGKEWNALPGQVWNWLSNVLPKVLQWAADLAVKANDAANRFTRAFNDEITKLPGQMLSVGHDILMGLYNGFMNASGWVTQQINGFVSGLLAGAKAAAGISSPSRLFAEQVGLPIAQGVALGIRQGAPTARGALGGLLADLPGPTGATAIAGASASAQQMSPVSGGGMEDTNDLLAALYQLLDERLPRGSRAVFGNAAYRPA